MFRTIVPVLFGALLLSACGGAKTSPDPARTHAEYLPWDSERTGLQSTDSGLQYIVLKEGPEDGKSPVPTDTVRVHYEGWLTTGEKFDSSYDTGVPALFQLNRVIPGWTLGLQEMSEGDVYLFHIPNALAYGPQARGDVIKAGDDLVFQVELMEVLQPSLSDAAAWDKYTPWNSDAPEVVKTGSGLEYIVLDSGDAAGESPVNGERVVMYYEGRLAETGGLFDANFGGAPMVHPSNRFIAGWVEALALMKPGDRWIMYIPSGLAYGEVGTPGGPIPPNADLIFEVEMVDVIKEN